MDLVNKISFFHQAEYDVKLSFVSKSITCFPEKNMNGATRKQTIICNQLFPGHMTEKNRYALQTYG